MRELIKGVTKIRGIEGRGSIHGKGILTYKSDCVLWVDINGDEHFWGVVCGEGDSWEFVDENESPKLKVGDLDMTYNIVPSDADENSVWTANHYDKYYHLTPEDIAEGKIRLDAYTVAKVWKIGSKDDSGALFHTFKLFPRWGEKNTVEREIVALYNQAKALARVYNVKLEDK